MKRGKQRFEQYLIQIEVLLAQAYQSKRPALWLYENDARTSFFMLEALGRLYEGMHDEKKFKKIRSWAKELEDGLGNIDFYDNYLKQFQNNHAIPVTAISYISDQLENSVVNLDRFLLNKKWVGENPKMTSKIRKKLEKIDWKKEKKECLLATAKIVVDCDYINAFIAKSKNGFTELEAEVHELRRNIRWLSIYARATDGLIQLADTFEDESHLQKYITDQVRQSPFTKMPEVGTLNSIILLEQNNFYALSSWIFMLGTLKDKGLSVLVLSEAIEKTENLSKEQSIKVACNLLNCNDNFIDNILKEASDFTTQMADEDVLTDLVIGYCQVDLIVEEMEEEVN
jgi:hypothetical protein